MLTFAPTTEPWTITLKYRESLSHWQIKYCRASTTLDRPGCMQRQSFTSAEEACAAYHSTMIQHTRDALELRNPVLVRAFRWWYEGRPGLRPRSSAARQRLDVEAEGVAHLKLELAQAHVATSAYATAHGLQYSLTALPDWLLPISGMLREGQSPEQVVDHLLDLVSDSLVLEVSR